MLRVIGLGSPFGDDAVGLEIIETLQQAKRLQPYFDGRLELLATDRPGPALLLHLKGAERALLIDAVVSGAPVGRLHRWSDVDEVENSQTSLSSHGFGLAQTLALGRQLGMLPGQLAILGIEIDPDAGQIAPASLDDVKYSLLINEIEEEILRCLAAQ
jgi:hydrogenase maturation protease